MRRLVNNIWMPITFLSVYLYALFMVRPIFSEGDPAWHLAAGDFIRQNGIPRTDPWAFTSGGVPWYNLSWGFDLFISYWNSVFGFGGVYIMMPAVLLVVVFICYAHCRMRAVSIQAACAVSLVAGIALSHSIVLRPQIVTFVLIAALHYFLHRDSIRKDAVAWIVFPLITLIWSNMHGGVIALFIVAGCYGLQYIIARDTRQILRFTAIGALCLVTVLLTPFGTGIFYGMTVSIVSVMNANIVEWWPLIPFMVFEQGLFLCLFIMVSNFKNPSIPFADRLIPLIWLLFALRSRRHFPLFVILSIPYVAISLDRMFEGSALYARVSERLQVQCEGIRGYYGAVAALFFAVTISILYLNVVNPYSYTRQSPALGQAVEYVAEHYPQSRVFNRFNDGGQMLYLAKMRFKIAIDGRIDTAYSQEFMAEYTQKVDSVQEGWMDVVKKYDTQIFVLPEKSKMAQALREYSDEWIWEKTVEAQDGKYYIIVNKSLHSEP